MASSVTPLQNYKRTKIIATVGPATDSYEAITNLIKAGVNGIRLNFSHGTNEQRAAQIEWIRKASAELDKPVSIIQDLQGPKIRLGDFEGIINVRKNEELSFEYGSNYEQSKNIPTQYDLSSKVKRGQPLYLYDGKIRTTVTSVKGNVVRVRAENDGVLIRRRGINVPETSFGGDVITPKDRQDLVVGTTMDIDYVALSFVQTADDIERLKKIIRDTGSSAKVIAKIETRLAVDNLESIVQAADVVMIARGDLAIEVPLESVPIIQRHIIGLGILYAKPTIVATQMLASMVEAADPTRAEVSDIASAVITGADCLMLSDETAIGRYPIEAVQVMKRVILYTEGQPRAKLMLPDRTVHSRQSAISQAIVDLGASINAKAIVAETKSGATAIHISALRPTIPLISVTNDPRTAQQLAIVYAAKSYVRPPHKLAATRLTDWLREHRILSKGDVVVTASGHYPGVVGTTDTIKVRMLK